MNHIHTKAVDYTEVINKPLGLFRSLTNLNHDIFAGTFNVSTMFPVEMSVEI
jgi:hypothetical protein